MPSPGRAALVDKCRIQRVWAIVDPVAQRVAAGRGKGLLELSAVFQNDNIPIHQAKQFLYPFDQLIFDDKVEALPVVIYDPPDVPQIVLPSLEESLENVPFVEFGVADDCNFATRWTAGIEPIALLQVILYEGGKDCHRDAESD